MFHVFKDKNFSDGGVSLNCLKKKLEETNKIKKGMNDEGQTWVIISRERERSNLLSRLE